MTLIHPPKAEDALAELQAAGEDVATEVLFPEARYRERRRRLIVLSAIILVSGLAAGLIASFGGSPPRSRSTTALPGDAGPPVALVGHGVIRGDGIGMAKFRQTEAVAIANLKKVLGQPNTTDATVIGKGGRCNTDAYLQWPTPIVAYFYRDHFVGYSTGNLGHPDGGKTAEVATTEGLRIGDTVAEANRLYPHKVRIGFENGSGTYSVTDKSGEIYGYLSAQGTTPVLSATILEDIWAGSGGCPAMTPWLPIAVTAPWSPVR